MRTPSVKNGVEDPHRVKMFEKIMLAQFPDQPEGRLWHAVLMQAVRDVFMPMGKWCGDVKPRRMDALRFLRGDMNVISKTCGIDPEWIRKKLRDLGIPIEKNRSEWLK